MSASHMNLLGLALDICGVLLLWKFGFPPDFHRGGVGLLAVAQKYADEAAKARRYDTLSHLALSLIVWGFTCQFVATLMQMP
jgi:hypothetical protein